MGFVLVSQEIQLVPDNLEHYFIDTPTKGCKVSPCRFYFVMCSRKLRRELDTYTEEHADFMDYA
eukprot:snap_masked-scaffold_5-processed-gene-16.57-mRNA-1 protein AED:1.00 eAED:1.00 QI:0/-1/0/0/-1/1/1/0/63